MSDFQCGKDIELYGKVVRLTAADEFTKRFYEKSGLEVGQEFEVPCDPYNLKKLKELEDENRPLPPEVIREKVLVNIRCGGMEVNHKYKQYLDSEGKVLRFYCLWRDQSEGGETHFYDLHYFLADDTVEMIEVRERSESCAAERVLFMKRRTVPRDGNIAPQASDSTDRNFQATDLRTDCTVSIGNRDFFIFDCDPFTKEYYRAEHQVEMHAVHLPAPEVVVQAVPVPPSTGFGSEEDSLNSCRLSLVPKPVQRERNAAFEGVVLRFTASSDRRDFRDRKFVVAFYPVDGSVAVWEEPVRNSGVVAGKFAEKGKRRKDTGEYYKLCDFAVGKQVTVSAVAFTLTGTDAFTAKWLAEEFDM